MGRLWVSDAPHVQNLAWNFRLDRRPWRHGDRCDCSGGASWSSAPAWLCGEQEVRRLEPCRHSGPYRGCEYCGACPAVRSQSPRSCFNCSHGTAPARADTCIFRASSRDAAFDCALPGATPPQIGKTLLTQKSHMIRRALHRGRRRPCDRRRERHFTRPFVGHCCGLAVQRVGHGGSSVRTLPGATFGDSSRRIWSCVLYSDCHRSPSARNAFPHLPASDRNKESLNALPTRSRGSESLPVIDFDQTQIPEGRDNRVARGERLK